MIEGRVLLCELCQKHNIPYKKSGKIIVAQNDAEIAQIDSIFQNGKGNGIADLSLLSQSELKQLESNVKAKAGLLSPSTGVIGAHSLMQFYAGETVRMAPNFFTILL